MPIAVGVKIRESGKRQYYHPGPLMLLEGEDVIVPTMNGPEYATIVNNNVEMDGDKLDQPLRQVTRRATEEDKIRLADNRSREQKAFAHIRERILAHRLDMKLVSVEYNFDQSRLTACFTSGGRVDFRALVRDLAATFRTRIELKQIGVRDEAKALGGIGSCGKPLCCSKFLFDFQPVSIRMAKEQNLSLNPTKISGMCGRLMCCLKYEQDHYEKARKRLPKPGREVMTPNGRGIVAGVNALLETVQVRVQSGEATELKTFTPEQIQRIGAPAPAPSAQPRPKAAALVPDDETFILDEEFLGTASDASSAAGTILEEE